MPSTSYSTRTRFEPVVASLADLVGAETVAACCAARAALTGESVEALQEQARRPVDFFPQAMQERMLALIDSVGQRVVSQSVPRTPQGASTRKFNEATNTGRAPLSAFGPYRVGEDGRLYLITKSEHYHTPLGHAFPGYDLLKQADALGIPNATHNNTRGAISRLLEEQLVRAAHGLDDAASLDDILASDDLRVLNRVLNLETGSLAVEAALKMILSRFYRSQEDAPEPRYHGRTPVLLTMGNDDGGLQANYHGTTMLTQTLRGMWPQFYAGLVEQGLFEVCPLRPNNFDDLEQAFARYENGRTKLAGFFHEIVMMNYGGKTLMPEFLQRAYELCEQHDVPTVDDEIQSCMWHHDLFMFREYNLRPTFVAVGKGFPGGLYPASRLVFSAGMDTLPQFGALVTNGQEELASLAYLVTMRWAQANACVTREVGDYYEGRVREFADSNADRITAVEGRRHMTTVYFRELDEAKAYAKTLNDGGLDISAQTYKADCPPAVLTKLPLIATHEVVDYVVRRMEQAIAALK